MRSLSKTCSPTRSRKKAKELEAKIIARLRKHGSNPHFIALGLRLEQLREQYEKAILTSIEFLKLLFELAKDVVRAEREVVPQETSEDKGLAALTELFNEVRT
jgi:type I restriction enzyme R subunit